uniref:Uncharacterized protein n=1 Tax=Anguilla anguilla TaxID=7936 RepID=A0A0E9VTF0_ANGAN
MMSPARSPSLT